MDTYDVGYINKYDYFKGFGFIRREKGKDVFFFYEDFIGDDSAIVEGESVRFILTHAERGPKALKIEKY